MVLVRSGKPGLYDTNSGASFEPDMVCDNCQTIFTAFATEGVLNLPDNLRVDVANASSCRLCESLLNVWTPDTRNDHYLDLKFMLTREGYPDGVLVVIFWPISQRSEALTAKFAFHMFNNKDGGYPRAPSYTAQIPSSTRSEHSGKQIRRWLEDCKGHEACRRVCSEADFIPSRLLEITRDVAGNFSIRLRCREELTHAITYATLSHCWGSYMPLKLEEFRVIQYRKRIPLKNISPVFRDAIEVSHALNLRYIWIDSLCIIQDSEEDWQTESAMMCDIYSYCHLNIAADDAEDGSWGLFRGRTPADLQPIHIVVTTKGASPYNSEFLKPGDMLEAGNYVLFDMHSWKHQIDNSPLEKRGWVLQERAMSPRTIHFGKTQIFWECRQLACNEVFPDGFFKGTIRRKAKAFLSIDRKGTEALRAYKQLKSKQDLEDKLEDEMRETQNASRFGEPFSETVARGIWHRTCPRNLTVEDYFPPDLQPYSLLGLEARHLDELRLPPRIKADIQQWNLAICPTNFEPPLYRYMSTVQQRWCDIVMAYTECSLSYTSDKLVAIAGMAQMMSKFTQCQYLGGLWRKDLEHQLLWKVVSVMPKAAQNEPRGPSWSWASVDGGVEWQYWQGGFDPGGFGDIRWLARVESCEVKTITPNLFGQVASGSLVITGPLSVLKLHVYPPQSGVQKDTLEACEGWATISWDCKETQEQFSCESVHIVWKYEVYDAPAHETSSYRSDVFFMPIRIMHHNDVEWHTERVRLHGLLLLPWTAARGTYQRIGLVTIDVAKYGGVFGSWTREYTYGTMIMDRRLYQSAQENGEYTIIIV
ncbi:hypothetical protein LTR17_025412 [Elasticomyces elasticus]|nr:hypothetical protein LTR17_025412 [Elasticomyces elasticus]